MSNTYEEIDETYRIRRFETGDRSGYLDLYETVFGHRRSDRWFEWKYVTNPYADHVPIILTERDGDIVGARSFFALPVQIRAERLLAFQPCDTMVHPDHRRQGLFTEMTKYALREYASGPPDLSFNFPNEKTLAGNRKLDWELVENVPRRYRLQDPGRSRAVPRPLRWSVAVGCTAYNHFRALGRDPDTTGVTVTRQASVPAARLAAIAGREASNRFHVPRDETFYSWRYDRPNTQYDVFLARREGSPVGAAIAGTGDSVRIMEMLPRTGRPEGVSAALLEAIVSDYRDASLLLTMGNDVESTLLRSFGFHSERNPVLKRVFDSRPFVVRPISGPVLDWDVDGCDLRNPENWLIGFADMDVN